MNEKFCAACGMPMNKSEDFGNGNTSMETCIYCTETDGSVKSCEEIFHGGIAWARETFAIDEDLAKRWVRRNMQLQRYGKTVWKDCACLQGALASDEEWDAILTKLKKMH